MNPLRAMTLTLVLATAATPQRGATGGSVKGKVLCEDTQGPARRAYISLRVPIKPGGYMPSGRFGAQADLDGSFTISNVTPGEYYVVAVYPGYINANEYIFPNPLSPELSGSREPLPPFVQRITVASGDTVNTEIRLKKGGSISGSLTYSDGAPIPNVALNAVVKMNNGTFERFGGAAHSDGAGRYRIDGLPDGSYAVFGALDTDVLTTFAGGGARATKGRLIVVTSPNETEGVNITIPLTGGHEIAGTVSALDGNRANHTLVRLYPTGEPFLSLATLLAADGTFSFHRVPPDSYTVKCCFDQYTLAPTGTGTADVIMADADLANVSVTVSPIH